MFRQLRLHCSVYVLYVVVFLDTLDKLLYVSLCIAFKNLELYVRKAGELSCHEFVTILLDPLLDGVECCKLTVKNDFCLFVLVLLLENLLYTVVDKFELELLKVIRVGGLHTEHALAVEHVVNAS